MGFKSLIVGLGFVGIYWFLIIWGLWISLWILFLVIRPDCPPAVVAPVLAMYGILTFGATSFSS
jgi:hypothetical protein